MSCTPSDEFFSPGNRKLIWLLQECSCCSVLGPRCCLTQCPVVVRVCLAGHRYAGQWAATLPPLPLLPRDVLTVTGWGLRERDGQGAMGRAEWCRAEWWRTKWWRTEWLRVEWLTVVWWRVKLWMIENEQQILFKRSCMV